MGHARIELVEAIVLRSSRYGKYQSLSTPSNHSKPFNQHVQGVKTWTLVGNYTAPTENYKQWFLTIHPDDMKKKHRPLSWYMNKDSLLCRFFGLYRIRARGFGNKIVIVMNNAFYSPLGKPLRVYDLKGSTHKREISEEDFKAANIAVGGISVTPPPSDDEGSTDNAIIMIGGVAIVAIGAIAFLLSRKGSEDDIYYEDDDYEDYDDEEEDY